MQSVVSLQIEHFFLRKKMMLFYILILNLGKFLLLLNFNDFFFSRLVFVEIQGKLVIRPSENLLIRDQHRSFIALCVGQGNSRVMGWRSPQQRDISESDNDRYDTLSSGRKKRRRKCLF